MICSLRCCTLFLLAALPAGSHAASCLLTVQDVVFPPYLRSAAQAVETTAMVSVECSGADGETVMYSITASTGSSNSYVARSFVGQPFEYNLYVDPNHSRVWGDGVDPASEAFSGTLTLPGNPRGPHVVYGQIPAQQNPDSGTVSDRITVQLTY
jgi:spore coat protein U-like protein